MRWLTPVEGTIRMRDHFLWLPVYIKGETRWLERARYKQKCWIASSSGTVYWDNIEWLRRLT